ncbi:hypothetical protein NW760_003219 [Fusarium oxysporum]|uniref:Uncharacterized protein n=1 Tax=Fusarium oxysporum f. sp. raphani TaxID=96318 RepID=A0A8J5NUB6_FUSOX|nr:hypothetical protein Forpi1262_v017357 [Fusarium oxysporum f. sp. raphani]KAJ4237783.1 hypothetical protein NW760_003219 [Fusarium oxysporum]
MILGEEYLDLTHEMGKITNNAQEPSTVGDPIHVCDTSTCAVEEPSKITFHQDTLLCKKCDILKELERRKEGALDKRDNIEYGVHTLTVSNQLPGTYIDREQPEESKGQPGIRNDRAQPGKGRGFCFSSSRKVGKSSLWSD